jgi:hypothetical protein
MRDQHLNPAEAVQALINCTAESAFGHHYGRSSSRMNQSTLHLLRLPRP